MHLGTMYNEYVTSQNMTKMWKMSECAYLPSVSIERVKRKDCYKYIIYLIVIASLTQK